MLDLDECGTFTLGAVFDGSGGMALRACTLAPGLFCATAMVEEKVDLVRMTVAQIRSELAAPREVAHQRPASSNLCCADGCAH